MALTFIRYLATLHRFVNVPGKDKSANPPQQPVQKGSIQPVPKGSIHSTPRQFGKQVDAVSMDDDYDDDDDANYDEEFEEAEGSEEIIASNNDDSQQGND